jgi:hypothetical protein
MLLALVRFAAALMVTLPLVARPLVGEAGPAMGAACASAEHRQFDFWIGNWDVALPDGSREGTNRIERILEGCVLRESWAGVKGSHGTSYNIYDAARRRWHQTWVDDRGQLLVLEGSSARGRMTLEGANTDSARRVQRQRIMWEQPAPDRVRQLRQRSSDGGATWTTLFDGRYTRR